MASITTKDKVYAFFRQYKRSDEDLSKLQISDYKSLMSHRRYTETINVETCEHVQFSVVRKTLISVQFEGVISDNFKFEIEINGNPFITINKPYLTFHKKLETFIPLESIYSPNFYNVMGFVGDIIFTYTDYTGSDNTSFRIQTNARKIKDMVTKVFIEFKEPIQSITVTKDESSIVLDEKEIDELYSLNVPGQTRPKNLAVIPIADVGYFFKFHPSPCFQILVNGAPAKNNEIYHLRDNTVLYGSGCIVARYV